jgi:hypothetical protein
MTKINTAFGEVVGRDLDSELKGSEPFMVLR